jgi:hypothetical protein
MPLWLQHTLVLLIVAICIGVVIAGAVRTFWGRRSRVGSCCSKGCAAEPAPPATGDARPERIVFFPADSLRVRASRESSRQ